MQTPFALCEKLFTTQTQFAKLILSTRLRVHDAERDRGTLEIPAVKILTRIERLCAMKKKRSESLTTDHLDGPAIQRKYIDKQLFLAERNLRNRKKDLAVMKTEV